MDNQITDIQTKKKLAHLFFSLLDLLCIWMLWIGYQDCNQIFNEIARNLGNLGTPMFLCFILKVEPDT